MLLISRKLSVVSSVNSCLSPFNKETIFPKKMSSIQYVIFKDYLCTFLKVWSKKICL